MSKKRSSYGGLKCFCGETSSKSKNDVGCLVNENDYTLRRKELDRFMAKFRTIGQQENVNQC
ncbi:hypothetical protein BLOT_014394 [Blomia tropicalis]|nr:hypothetical protein BLOT_014394 [Blomia tropicalis]